VRIKSERFQQYLVITCDLIALSFAWSAAVILTGSAGPPISNAFSGPHQWRFLLTELLTLWVPIAIPLQIYARSPERMTGMFRALQAVVLVVSIAMIVEFLFADMTAETGREFLKRFIPISCLTLFVARKFAPRAIMFAVGRLPSPLKPSLAVIAEKLDSKLIEQLRTTQSAVLKGVIVPGNQTMQGLIQNPWLPVLGPTGELAAVINRERLDKIILMNGAVSEPELQACNTISKRMGVTMSWAVAVPEPSPNLSFSVEFGMHVLEMAPVRFTRGQRLIKRIFDITVVLATLIVLSPVMALIALLVRATSKGPICYRAPRVGLGGRYFTFLKFRTMYADSDRQCVRNLNEKDGHLFKMRNDPRVTAVGRFLRRYSLDELPQLLNVLAGDMSLVGPRPLPVEDMDPDGMSSRFAVWSEQRASVPPGITGLWQIRGRSALPFTDLVKYDLEYVHQWSLMLDLKILLQTPAFVLSGKGAY
jgi:exopolysaccharide biosynthesis polyprenyl glycosylphosphotransferase